MKLPWILLMLSALVAIFGMPLALIWAVNTLFGLTIAYTFKTWLATVLLAGVFKAHK
jgi:hypothetical protein